MNDATEHLRILRNRLCLVRMAIHGAVVRQPQAAIEFGLVLGGVEQLIADAQLALNQLQPEPGANFPTAGLIEPGPEEGESIN